MTEKDRLIVALDFDNEAKALGTVKKLQGEVRFFKVGFELFSSCGPGVVEKIQRSGCAVFLDLKFHDIPNTVAKAAAAATRLGVYMFNCHALGGLEMMRAATLAAEETSKRLKVNRPKVLAVTILTSMSEMTLKDVGINDTMKDTVLKLARLARKSGLDGVVASPQEAKLIRQELGKDFLIVTPGVRPAAADSNDQKRVATPKEAIKLGADYIVVGRPVTEAQDPVKAAQTILREIEG